MKARLRKISWFMTLGILFSTCLTIDQPPPDHLSAPLITGYTIITKKDLYDQYHESIHLTWKPDTTDPISVWKYEIVHKTSYDSFFLATVHNIPGSINEYSDFTSNLNLSVPRISLEYVFYRVFAFDSLERVSDTSVACTVSLAPHVDLLHPLDTLRYNSFRWLVPQLFNPPITAIMLIKNDTLMWQSGYDTSWTGGAPLERIKSLPDSLIPLIPGNYSWGVVMQLIGGITQQDPSSITIREFHVK